LVPLLISRHPIIVLELLLVIITVRVACLPPAAMRWRWIARLAVLFAAIGVVFNALTVRTGNQVAFDLPGLGWEITWNAIAYGLISGLAMITLVLAGITAAAGLDWIALTRVLPGRLAPLAVSGSVAWSFLPGASQAINDIREAQAARGHRLRGARDVLPIVVPLLDGSLGRALTMSEALEARGFGAATNASVPGRNLNALWSALVVLGALSLAYAISLGDTRLLWPAIALVVVGAAGISRSPQAAARTTRYREHRLHRADGIVIGAAIVSLIMFLAVASRNFDAITFNPYPNLELPPVDYRLLASLALLLAPAFYPVRGQAG
jgi:energy-coupling factor transport system permease protein